MTLDRASSKTEPYQSTITFADRFVCGLLSAIAAICTAAFLGMVLLFRAGEASTFEFWAVFVRWSGGFAVVAAVVGFIVGPDRAAEYWGLIWGTEDAEKHRGPVIIFTLLIIFFSVMMLLGMP